MRPCGEQDIRPKGFGINRKVKLPRQCAILVGGLGTRMGHLTAQTPKPLLGCGDRPFLAWVLRELARFGIEEVILLAGHKSEQIDRFCLEAPAYLPKPMSIKVSIEPKRAGTGGAVWYARELLDDAFVLINGDSWIDINLARFLAMSAAVPDALGCILLRDMEDCSRYGTVDLRGNRVVGFHEKASIDAPGVISSGIYIFDRDVFSFLTPECSLEIDVLPGLAEKGLLYGKVFDGYFIDIGIPVDYARACKELPSRLMRGAVFFDRDGVLNEDTGWVGSFDRFKWVTGARDALRLVNEMGLHAFVVTNQAGVARGLYTESDVETLHSQILGDLRHYGGTIDDLRFCPFHPTVATEKAYLRDSNWRKPEPGMILDLLARWGVDSHKCILVGDKESDLHAARNAGIAGYLYSGGSLLEFCEPLVSHLGRPMQLR
jgi:D,D-heptose 1,7-bisphosphate phosphatase